LIRFPCHGAPSAYSRFPQRDFSWRTGLVRRKRKLPKPQNVLSPDASLNRLLEGNSRYVKEVTLRHDFKHEREALAGGHNPYAAVLSCADSRIAPEYAFVSGRGDLFVCRVAGNFASDEMIASLEYAVAVLATPLILVLGHDSCGAVDATKSHLRMTSRCPDISRLWLQPLRLRSRRCCQRARIRSRTRSGST
jgi:carbonic anhydrase